MADRRFYGRFKTGIRALMYYGELHREKNCEVANISENGICFEVFDKDLITETIRTGDKIDFQFVDDYVFFSLIKSVVVSGNCIVKHVDVRRDKIVIGCFLKSGEFEKYVQDRKLAAIA